LISKDVKSERHKDGRNIIDLKFDNPHSDRLIYSYNIIYYTIKFRPDI